VDVVLGDLIEIGEHRLLCGDSTDAEQVVKLMDGEKCNLITDPPYGINANKQTLGTGKKQFYRGDSWDTEVPNFYYILTLVNKAIIWGGNYFTENLKVSNDWLCWYKKNDNLSYSEFELAWTNIGNNCRHLSHHWGKESKLHPTMKPIKVIEWCINMLDNKPILDVFLGSGSTMVAAHQLKRKCYGMELDPKYCQVIIDRMIKLDPSIEVKINGKKYH
jgi:DNA modification methylase